MTIRTPTGRHALHTSTSFAARSRRCLKLSTPASPLMQPRLTTAGNSALKFRANPRPNSNGRVSTSLVRNTSRYFTFHSCRAGSSIKRKTSRGARFAIINQTMARQYFPNGDAIGSQLRVPELKGEPPFQLTVPESDSWIQIGGIAGDARDDGVSKPIKPQFYVPYTMSMPVWTQILVRTQSEPLALVRAVRQQIQTVDPDQQVFREVRSLERWIRNQPEYAREHMIAFLFAVFGALALALAATGLYSVVSYTVAQRTGEFGIRMALGALRKDVVIMVFRSAGGSVGSGVLAGVVLALVLNQVLSRWIEGSPRNPLVLVGVTVVLIVTSAVACLVPAKRASSVDPMVALRYE